MNNDRAIQAGGNVIGSGGFGCVFAPALRCDTTAPVRPNMISKLMVRKNAIEEYTVIKEIRRVVSKIPNYDKYFLLNNISVCRPAPLSEMELAQYSRKCHMLERHGITPKNMNENLPNLTLLNMPQGGTTIEKYIETHPENINHDFVIINDNLIGLLLNGIIKMNRLGVYHCDIKGSNVLIDDQLVPRLIDWGLSNIEKTGDIESWRHYSVQFNTPFSSVLFGAHFEKSIEDWGERGGAGPLYDAVRRFVRDYMGKQRHMAVITNIMFMLFLEEIPAGTTKAQKGWIYDNKTVPIITDYLYKVVQHFNIVKYGHVNPAGLDRYLKTVYIHLVDVWGFVMIYLGKLEILYQNVDNLTAGEMRLYKKIRGVFLKYLYMAPTHAPNVRSLVADLRRLNEEFKTTNYNLYTHATLVKYTSYQKLKRAMKKQISL